MKYEEIWKRTLNEGEDIKFEFSISERYCKFCFKWQLIVLVLLFSWTLFFPFFGIPFLALISGLIYFFYRVYLPRSRAYALTNKRILIHTGWLSTTSTSIPYSSIVELSASESFFMMHKHTQTGNVVIKTAGAGGFGLLRQHDMLLEAVDEPYEIKKKIEKLKN